MRVAYLGPPGTFSEEALLGLLGPGHEAEAIPLPSVAACVQAVVDYRVSEALVPVENSLEGPVSQTLDQLVGGRVMIRAEVIHPVRLHLIGRTRLAPGAIRRVMTHPQPASQCQEYLRSTLPDAEVVATASTAEAVRAIMASDEPWAAIGTLRAADIYGGEVIAADVEDSDDNHTRFVLVGREPLEAVGPGRFKTSIVCAPPRDRPGALLSILQEFAMRGVNLTRLESRPTKTGLGKYVFFIDIEGSRARDLPVEAALTAIEHQGVAAVTFLGSYPAAPLPG